MVQGFSRRAEHTPQSAVPSVPGEHICALRIEGDGGAIKVSVTEGQERPQMSSKAPDGPPLSEFCFPKVHAQKV